MSMCQIDAILQGFALNWDAVREVWYRNYITDVDAYCELLELVPDKSSCLRSVAPSNLAILMEHSRIQSLILQVVRILAP
jgi:hypothetical protein